MKNYNDNDIKIINTSTHKNLTDKHLAQVNFTAVMPVELWNMYINKINIDHKNLGRIRFMESNGFSDYLDDMYKRGFIMVFGRVSHGYGYGIEQDVFNAIIYSKGVKKDE